MKLLKRICLIFCLFYFQEGLQAQMVEDPTSWNYEVRKARANEYDLIFHVTLKKGWHIFSQAPGDEFLIPPSFQFDSSGIKMVGKVAERGNLLTEKFEGVDNPVHYYTDKVDFVQRVRISGRQVVKGVLEYQVCNDRMCLPPKKKDFVFRIR